jgi:flagellar basal-body rod modification protein FlgD
MMNVRGGTQTWSNAQQTSSFKSDDAKNLSPEQLEKALGGENLGEVLNKIADPNWVDPAKTRKVGNNELDKDAFLKLMLAQMKHQDPGNPMQSHEMASQLAQFTSLEQLNNINATLEGMKNAQTPSVNYQALNFIGKKVAGDSSKLLRVVGDKTHNVSFNIAGDAAEVKVKVRDGEGKVVRTLSAKNLKAGSNSIAWNGLNETGQAAPPGEYRFTIEASSATGGKVFAKTDFDGRITGLNFTPQGPVLMVGNQTVRLQDVKKIYEPSPEEQMMDRLPATPLKAAGAAGAAGVPAMMDDVPAASEDALPSAGAMMKNLNVSREMKNQVNQLTESGATAEPAPETARAEAPAEDVRNG